MREQGTHCWRRVSMSKDTKLGEAKSAQEAWQLGSSDSRYNEKCYQRNSYHRARSWKARFLCFSKENSVLRIKSKFSRTEIFKWKSSMISFSVKTKNKQKKDSLVASAVREAGVWRGGQAGHQGQCIHCFWPSPSHFIPERFGSTTEKWRFLQSIFCHLVSKLWCWLLTEDGSGPLCGRPHRHRKSPVTAQPLCPWWQ